MVYGFIESVDLGWGHPLVFGSLIVGVACLIVFVFFEARVSSPMVPLALFGHRHFRCYEPPHPVSSLRRSRNLLFLVPAKPHPGSGILGNCDGRCRATAYSSNVFSCLDGLVV